MDSSVISDHLNQLLGERRVIAAAFTTYTFEPAFFELEVVPLLLPRRYAFSVDERVKRIQVREALRDSGLALEVFLDHHAFFAEETESSPGMEYGFTAVRAGNAAFHAKVCLILVDNGGELGRSLLVGAGSANLTYAGWWENIECQHWEEIPAAGAWPQFVADVRADVAYLFERRTGPFNTPMRSLEPIAEFLDECTPDDQARPVQYFGIARSADGSGFPGFATEALAQCSASALDTVEIVSPFFADDPGRGLEGELPGRGEVGEYRLLLPTDQEGSARCTPEYLQAVEDAESIQWAAWREPVRQALGLQGAAFRVLHAKLYQFFSADQAWVFVGSVNFTHKAFYENVEAGFLVSVDEPASLLVPFDASSVPSAAEHLEAEPGADDDAIESVLPAIHVAYDWKSGVLSGREGEGRRVSVDLLSQEQASVPAVAAWVLGEEEARYEGDVSPLLGTLRNTSLVRARGHWEDDGYAFPEHTVLVVQLSWTHKPLLQAELTPQQILAIYAGMSEERRQMMLVSAEMRRLVRLNQGGELTEGDATAPQRQFFAEYAELFHAFRKLRRHLERLAEENNERDLDYYLSGTGVDSLPALVDRADPRATAEDDDEILDDVTAYLTLLCIREILVDPMFSERPGVAKEGQRVGETIQAIRDDHLRLAEGRTPGGRERFFQWFESVFQRSVESLAEGVSDAS